MNNMKKRIFLTFLVPVLLLSGVFTAFAQTPTGPGYANSPRSVIFGTEIPAGAEVLVLVESNHEETDATGSLSIYARSVAFDDISTPAPSGTWSQVIAPVKAVMGRKGMGKTAEGDEKTPLGLFRMDTPFGIAPAEEGFPRDYLQVGPQHYWSGDTKGNAYNRLVDINAVPGLDKKKSEHLCDITTEYQYCLNVGYNPQGEAGLGSAIFLHCVNSATGRGTGGCIAVDKEVMKQILKLYRPWRTYILIR